MFRNNKRWVIGFLMFLGIVINYMDRVNISHAILFIKDDLKLTPFQQGIILSSFSWGYVAFMLIGGYLTDKKGSRLIVSLSCLGWSFFTMLGTLAGNFNLFLATRVGVGMAEAPIFPSNAKVVKAWFPKNERGLATSLFDSGSYVGSALAAPLIILLMVTFGWKIAFIIFGVVGLLWSLVWYLYYREPEDFIGLSDKEKQIIPIEENTITNSQKISWKKLILNRKILSISFGFFCYNYLKNFFLTWFPTYLATERGFSIIKIGFVAILPPLMAIFGELLMGYLTDKMITKGVNLNIARKLPLCLGLLTSSIIVLSVFVSNEILAVILLTISYTALISASTGIWAIPGDISKTKHTVGIIGGVQNTFSNIAGIIAPLITGYLVQTTGSFIVPIVVSGILTIFGAASYWYGLGDLEEKIDFTENA